MNFLLIAIRALHFASTVLLAGALVFAVLVAGPVVRHVDSNPELIAWWRQSARIAWISVTIAVLSGAAWLVVLAAEIGSRSLGEIFSDDIVWRVLTRTRFGTVWSARFVTAALLAGGLIALARADHAVRRRLLAIIASLAVLLVGSLGWAGHASGTPALAGRVHVAADALHLVAASAWIGGLVPLALLLVASRRIADPAVTMIARDATSRFSILGMIVVGTILVTGMVNTYMLAGSVAALTTTHYGHLLLLKIGLFLAMVGVAAFNRLRLVPRLSSAHAVNDASRQLQRNSLIEATMGLLILVIVGVLGTLPPAIHAVDSAHMHAD
ncbi:MAG TPA: copper homeostasis membrane protein CopD [Casimicrobiaceae bacterium]|jgi:putative copper resistance protein D